MALSSHSGRLVPLAPMEEPLMEPCTYCDTEADTLCAASGEPICDACSPDHVSGCGTCAYEIYEAM